MSNHIAGVLLHITSLPSQFPSGSLGTCAHQFLDWMSDCGLKLWQTLPLHPIDGALSPYSSTSAFAGAPHLIDVEILAEQGWFIVPPRGSKSNTMKSCMEPADTP